MLDVLPHLVGAQRLEPEASRDALLELTEFRPRQHRLEICLPHQNDLKQRATFVVDIGEQADLLENVRFQVLCLVDDDDRVRLERDEGGKKILQRVYQVVPARRPQLGPVLRDHAEVLEELFQEIVAFELRVIDDRDERLARKPLEHGATEERLADADLARDDDERFAPLDRIGDLSERGRVSPTFEHESGVGSQAERRLAQAEEALVTRNLRRMADGVHRASLY